MFYECKLWHLRDWKTGRNVLQPLVISLTYENKVTVKKFPYMKVQTNAKPSSILGGNFIGGEMAWRQGDQIPYQDNY